MRLSSRASSAVAALALTAFMAGCERVDGERAGESHALGEELLTQQVPPGGAPDVRRPTVSESDELSLRLPPDDEPPGRHAFYWTRAVFSGDRARGWWRGGPPAWATDFPKGDRQFLVVLKRLVRLDAYTYENAVSLADPRLRRFPMIYAVEVGYMDLTPDEIRGLRNYLNAGGLLVVDDFWGTQQWARFERNIRAVLPGRPIVDIPLTHPLFSSFYDIDEVKQVPARGRGIRGRPTWERDGYVPYVRGILDDHGEIMVLINWNTDLGDAWEWAEDPMYPLEYSTYAYEMGANMIVYGMSH